MPGRDNRLGISGVWKLSVTGTLGGNFRIVSKVPGILEEFVRPRELLLKLSVLDDRIEVWKAVRLLLPAPGFLPNPARIPLPKAGSRVLRRGPPLGYGSGGPLGAGAAWTAPAAGPESAARRFGH